MNNQNDIDMTREELIKDCKYYKGEIKAPVFDDQNKNMLWFYEQYWVQELINNPKSFKDMGDEYETYPTELIDKDEKVPYTLKTLLLNRYCKGSMGTKEDDAKSFNEFLQHYY